MAAVLIYVFLGQELAEKFVRREAVAAGDRMRLFDEDGNTRVYMRVHSGAPVLQLIDESGMPRLSLGLRYNDAPFINLSDAGGQTRASLQIGADDKPVLTLFNDNGESSFSAN